MNRPTLDLVSLHPVKNGSIIVASVSAIAWLSYLATINHGLATTAKPAITAGLVTLLGTIPPLFFGRLLSNSAANQLAIVAWRIGIMLPAVAIATVFGGDERKCYLIALLACYFVSLPLESWLLIRDVRRMQATNS